MRKLLLCGIASSVVYVAADLLGAAVYPGYSYVDHTISELSALGAPSRPLVLPLLVLYAALMMGFAIGLWLSAGHRRALRAIAVVVGLYALACIPVTPMHTREALGAGAGSLTDQLHITITIVDSALLVSMMVIAAVACGGAFRVYTIVSLIVMLACGAFAGSMGGALGEGGPTPWLGVIERVTVFGAMLWVAIFATVVARRAGAGGGGRWHVVP